MNYERTISSTDIAKLIAEGQTIVIFEDRVLQLDSWLSKHPGGCLAIMHMVGRDATDEITAYHARHTLLAMKAFQIGRKPVGPWNNMTPPIRGGTQGRLHDDLSNVCLRNNFEPSRTNADLNKVTTISKQNRHRTFSSDKNVTCGELGGGQGNLDGVPGGEPDNIHVEIPGQTNRTERRLRRDVIEGLHEYPPVATAVQGEISKQYRLLHQQVRDEGLYNCNYREYAKEVARYAFLFILFITALRCNHYAVSAVFLGLFWHQIMFTAHDAGHSAITHHFAIDSILGIFVANFCCGLSIGWWKSSHNIHHLVTNQPEHDPDIQNIPLFATCPSFLQSLSSSYYNSQLIWNSVADLLVPYQRYMYYPIMGIARFNLYLLSWLHLLSAKSKALNASKAWWIRPTEIIFMSGYWFLFGYCLLYRTLPTWTDRIIFVLISHAVTMPLHVQITLSHWGMSTADLGNSESFAQRQLRTTMDIECPAWLDFVHGGLQFQTEHHLFPRVPRHNLRRVQVLAKQFSQNTGIPYTVLGFVEGNCKVLGRLEEVSSLIRILIRCQEYMIESGESGLQI